MVLVFMVLLLMVLLSLLFFLPTLPFLKSLSLLLLHPQLGLFLKSVSTPPASTTENWANINNGGRPGAEQTGITDLMQTVGAGLKPRVCCASSGLILLGAGGAEQTGTADLILTGVRVVIQCRNSSGNQVLYSEVVSDSNGKFHVNLDYYHDQQVCKFQLRSSPDASCNITTEKSISFVNGSSFEGTMELSLSPLKKPLSCAELSDLYALPPRHLPPNCGPSPPLPIQLPNPTPLSRPYFSLPYFSMPPTSPGLPTPASKSPPCPKEEILGNNPPPPPPF